MGQMLTAKQVAEVKQLNDAVLDAYEQALTQSQNSMAKHHEMQQAPEGQAMDMTGM